MSTFDLAIPTVLKHEGLFSNDPNDPGGATKYGISLRWLKSLTDRNADGFLVGDLDHDGDVDINDIKDITQDDAKGFYKKYWWDRYGYQSINDQSIATKILDLSVNMGSIQAHTNLQRACLACYGIDTLQVDGKLGAITFALINKANIPQLLAAFRSETAGFYRTLIAINPSSEKYQDGWMTRAYA